MFRALTCPSSGGQIVFTQHLVSSLSVNVCTVHRLRADCRAVRHTVVFLTACICEQAHNYIYCIILVCFRQTFWALTDHALYVPFLRNLITFTSQVLVRSQVSPCGICGVESVSGKGDFRGLLFPHCQIHSTFAPHSLHSLHTHSIHSTFTPHSLNSLAYLSN